MIQRKNNKTPHKPSTRKKNNYKKRTGTNGRGGILMPLFLVILLFFIGGGLMWSYHSGTELPFLGNLVSQFKDTKQMAARTLISMADHSNESSSKSEDKDSNRETDDSILSAAKKSVKNLP